VSAGPSAARDVPALPAWLSRTHTGWVIQLHVQPGARHPGVQGVHGDALKVRLAAPPVEGKANAALLAFLAERLDVPRRDLLLVAGLTSRSKRVALPLALAAPQIVSALRDDDRLGALGREGG